MSLIANFTVFWVFKIKEDLFDVQSVNNDLKFLFLPFI